MDSDVPAEVQDQAKETFSASSESSAVSSTTDDEPGISIWSINNTDPEPNEYHPLGSTCTFYNENAYLVHDLYHEKSSVYVWIGKRTTDPVKQKARELFHKLKKKIGDNQLELCLEIEEGYEPSHFEDLFDDFDVEDGGQPLFRDQPSSTSRRRRQRSKKKQEAQRKILQAYIESSYVVTIGVDRYKTSQDLPNLNCACADADLVEKTLVAKGFQVIAKLRNEQATTIINLN